MINRNNISQTETPVFVMIAYSSARLMTCLENSSAIQESGCLSAARSCVYLCDADLLYLLMFLVEIY